MNATARIAASSSLVLAVVVLAASPTPALAQAMDPTMDHSKMHHPAPAPAPAKPKPKPKPPASSGPEAMDHATMDHAAMDHAGMDHAAMEPVAPPPGQPRTPIPVLTAEDRAAAFPDVAGHPAHDRSRHAYWLVDRLETRDTGDGTGVDWKSTAWIGGDIHRLWLRTEGESTSSRIERGDIELLGGRMVSPWWDLVAGVRHDVGQGPSQTFAALGIAGTAPYKVDIEATAYLGSAGQTAARVEASYDTLLSNRWILQWHAEANLYGKDDAARGVGAGLSTLEGGLRLRYEITRRVAPYIGLVRERAFGATADWRRSNFEDVDDTRLVAGVRVRF